MSTHSKGPIQTILIIEDDREIRETFRDALESEGYRVVTAENGQDGLERFRELPKPCLVLLDFMMPIMGGREFLDTAMTDSYLAPIPVVVISASIGDASSVGAKRVLKKPLDLDVLLKVVAQYAK